MEEIKQKTEAELAQEAIERKILEERRAARRRKEAREAKMKLLLEVLFLLVVFVGGAMYKMHKFAAQSKYKLEQDTLLNATTQQVSQIIDNVRKAYAIYSEEKEISMERLIELGAIPESIVDGKEAYNLYNGNIVIEASRPLENIKEAVESPTFKMAYRGLPHSVCVNLAVLNWGDKINGLMAVAIGDYDGERDTALDEIDKIYEEEKPIEFIDKFGRIRTIQPRKHYALNVAKPGDSFIPTPFTRDNAEGGCSCSRSDSSCSFAWRYAIYAVDKPNRVESEIEKMERLMKERLEQRVKEQEAEQQRLRDEELKKRATEAMKKELEAQQQATEAQQQETKPAQ
ncbi:MAG: type 4 pilus major pilin [Alphaproteobacteria bacterium]